MSTRIKTVFVVVLSVLLCSFYSLNTSAVSLTEEVQFYESGTPAYYRVQFSNGDDTGYINSYYTNGSTPQNISSLSIKSSSNTAFSSLTDGRYFTFTIRMRFKGVSDKWNTSGAWTINPTSVNCPIIDVTEGDSQFHDLNNITYTYETLLVSCKYSGSGGVPTTNFTIASSQYTTDWQMRVLNYSVWGRQNLASADDVAAVTTAVNSMKNAITSKLDTTNDKLDTLDISINDLKQAQEDYNTQQQQQYEDEKQEESDREDNISGDAEDAQGIFSFEVLNPFSGIFGLFSNSCSVNIPILASWLHSPTSTYTSWWCSSDSTYHIRYYLTQVFGISSMMLLFGFVVRWLSNNSGDIYGARNFKKGLE